MHNQCGDCCTAGDDQDCSWQSVAVWWDTQCHVQGYALDVQIAQQKQKGTDSCHFRPLIEPERLNNLTQLSRGSFAASV